MNFDFDKLIDRRNTASMKWNTAADELPMWVADMDFQTAPCIQEAIQKKAACGIYGYSDVPHEYYTSYQNWWEQRYHYRMETEWMIFSSGVIPAISSMIRKLTTPAEKILLQAPVYNIFYHSILNNGRQVITSDLRYENGSYEIDFEDLEHKLKDPQTVMMILCNPHNPIGKVWTREELKKIGFLCHKHHVLVISDEVHGDLTAPGISYTPFASVDTVCENNSITCLSAGKAFNLAGLQSACIVAADPYLRHRIWRGLNTDEAAEPNVFACSATIAAFQKGGEWLDALRQYLHENRRFAREYIETRLPQLHLVAADATYLLWIDCAVFHPYADQFCNYLQREKKLLLSSGISFGNCGEDFIRMNIACPKARMMTGLERLKEGVEDFLPQAAEYHEIYFDSKTLP